MSLRFQKTVVEDASQFVVETKENNWGTYNSSHNPLERQFDGLQALNYSPPQVWTPTAEILNGRLAMCGMFFGYAVEFASGKSLISQIKEDWLIFAFLLPLGGLLWASARRMKP